MGGAAVAHLFLLITGLAAHKVHLRRSCPWCFSCWRPRASQSFRRRGGDQKRPLLDVGHSLPFGRGSWTESPRWISSGNIPVFRHARRAGLLQICMGAQSNRSEKTPRPLGAKYCQPHFLDMEWRSIHGRVPNPPTVCGRHGPPPGQPRGGDFSIR